MQAQRYLGCLGVVVSLLILSAMGLFVLDAVYPDVLEHGVGWMTSTMEPESDVSRPEEGRAELPECEAPNQGDALGMVTGGDRGTYHRFGKDVRWASCAQEGLAVDPKPTKGSLHNIDLMLSNENAALGIIQSDLADYLATHPDYRSKVDRLRLVYPLFNEEVHVLAKRSITRLEDLSGRVVARGPAGSGTAISTLNILSRVGVVPARLVQTTDQKEAIDKVVHGEYDALFYIAGKPVPLFSSLAASDAWQHVHLLPVDHPALLVDDFYVASSFSREDYPNLPAEEVPTIAVKAILVGYHFRRSPSRCAKLGAVSRAIRCRLPHLVAAGHPKWSQVDLDAPMAGWRRHACLAPADVDCGMACDLKAWDDLLSGDEQATHCPAPSATPARAGVSEPAEPPGRFPEGGAAGSVPTQH